MAMGWDRQGFRPVLLSELLRHAVFVEHKGCTAKMTSSTPTHGDEPVLRSDAMRKEGVDWSIAMLRCALVIDTRVETKDLLTHAVP